MMWDASAKEYLSFSPGAASTVSSEVTPNTVFYMLDSADRYVYGLVENHDFQSQQLQVRDLNGSIVNVDMRKTYIIDRWEEGMQATYCSPHGVLYNVFIQNRARCSDESITVQTDGFKVTADFKNISFTRVQMQIHCLTGKANCYESYARGLFGGGEKFSYGLEQPRRMPSKFAPRRVIKKSGRFERFYYRRHPNFVQLIRAVIHVDAMKIYN